MASTATAEAISSRSHTQTKSAHEPDNMESNHDLPARTMADDEHEQSDLQTEDPATTAASEELRQTTISDSIANHSKAEPVEGDSDSAETEDKDMGGTVKASTPEPAVNHAQDEEMKGLLSPPKKKRGRDDQEEEAALEQSSEKDETSSADGTATNGKRTRSEPEKKRVRDKEASSSLSGAPNALAGFAGASVLADPGAAKLDKVFPEPPPNPFPNFCPKTLPLPLALPMPPKPPLAAPPNPEDAPLVPPKLNPELGLSLARAPKPLVVV